MSLSRRRFLRYAAAGGGTLLVPRIGAREAAAAAAEPHFFLMIVLNGGADPAYMFDARPLSMTRAGRIQNYLGREPFPYRGNNGIATLASPLVEPLLPFRHWFSVLNGVYMAPGFDGHLQNMNFLFAGNPFGGESFVPHLNLAETGRERASLDAVSPSDPLPVNVDNHSAVVSLNPWATGGLAASMKVLRPIQAGDPLAEFVRGRVKANAAGPGRFAAGAQRMLDGLDGAPSVQRQLAKLVPPHPEAEPENQAVDLVAQCFRQSIARSAIYVLPEFFDVHSAEQARAQPKLFTAAIARLREIFEALDETPFDARRSMMDVTTVMVASEFGRTMRIADSPIHATGTNHNSLANSVLLAGKGIRGGLVVGASDLANERAQPSGAHRAMDPALEKAMGTPFDFAAMRPISELPDHFEIEDHLTIASVINTIYDLFGVPESRYRSLGRNLPVAPVLHGLLA
ncbi:MAG: DUF1501 domain-containing protein [Candidatus Odyssella sp.]|nr:DUF1501 domain-containing protein [Candidatus Odyssella sp.]